MPDCVGNKQSFNRTINCLPCPTDKFTDDSLYPRGKTSTDVERTTSFGPLRKFPDVLIRRGRRKDVASTSRPNRTYE